MLDVTEDATQKNQYEYKNKIKNAVAMGFFTLVFQMEELKNTIDNAATTEWPG